jgi:hypothetical protein
MLGSAKCRVNSNTVRFRVSAEARDDPSYAHSKGATAL